jgi:hypothetical protein
MSTPLLISESIPLECKKILETLEIGRRVKYKETEGYISFICDEYLNICFKEKPAPPGSSRQFIRCELLVFRSYWEDLLVDDTHMHDVILYKGRVNDHPGNEMLPHAVTPIPVTVA